MNVCVVRFFEMLLLLIEPRAGLMGRKPRVQASSSRDIPQPGEQTVGVSNHLRQVNLFVRILWSGWYARWVQDLYWFGKNVPTSNFWWLTLSILFCSMLVVGVTNELEREELPSILCMARPKDYETGALC
jgi:hypothetical protein